MSVSWECKRFKSPVKGQEWNGLSSRRKLRLLMSKGGPLHGESKDGIVSTRRTESRTRRNNRSKSKTIHETGRENSDRYERTD